MRPAVIGSSEACLQRKLVQASTIGKLNMGQNRSKRIAGLMRFQPDENLLSANRVLAMFSGNDCPRLFRPVGNRQFGAIDAPQPNSRHRACIHGIGAIDFDGVAINDASDAEAAAVKYRHIIGCPRQKPAALIRGDQRDDDRAAQNQHDSAASLETHRGVRTCIGHDLILVFALGFVGPVAAKACASSQAALSAS